MAHLCFMCTSMSDAILSDCLSAVICHMAATRNGKLVGRFTFHAEAKDLLREQLTAATALLAAAAL